MKIGILTQPLQGNYGGIIQNWALQQELIKLGFDVITLNVYPRDLTCWQYLKCNLISILATFVKRKRYKYRHLYKHKVELFSQFIYNNISTTEVAGKYSKEILIEYKIDALVVGSDQVWRPMYNNGCLEDMFFAFAEDITCPKFSYAASFGTDEWEYNDQQTKRCKELIAKFDKISVREPSGIQLCKEHLGVDSVQVLDPTLLLDKHDYINLIKGTPRLFEKPFLAAYVLDIDKTLRARIMQKSKDLNLEPIIITADNGAALTMEQWISLFRDAEYIFTDSFHGSVFSYIFNKPFECVKNEVRGASRFKVIEDLLASDCINEKREQSINFLKSIYGSSKS